MQDPHRGLMVTTSLGVIVFTTVFFGAVMPFFTRGLKPERVEPPPSASMFQYRESLSINLFSHKPQFLYVCDKLKRVQEP